MDNVKALLNTSVADAKSSLECLLMSNPQQALDDAQLAVDFINQYGRPSIEVQDDHAGHHCEQGHESAWSFTQAKRGFPRLPNVVAGY